MSRSFKDAVNSQTMSMNFSCKTGNESMVYEALCNDFFVIVMKMLEIKDLGDPSSLRKLIIHYLDKFDRNCKSYRIPDKNREDVKYAVIALIDETVLSIKGPCREYWLSSPLQLDIFGDNFAGEGFFSRLKSLTDESQKNIGMIRIYYLCLSLGFEGKYRIESREEREKVIEKLETVIGRSTPGKRRTISPHAFRKTVYKKRPEKIINKIQPYYYITFSCLLFLGFEWIILFFNR